MKNVFWECMDPCREHARRTSVYLEQEETEKKALRGHNGDEAKGTIASGISAFKKIFGSYQEYLAREDAKEDDKTKEDL